MFKEMHLLATKMEFHSGEEQVQTKCLHIKQPCSVWDFTEPGTYEVVLGRDDKRTVTRIALHTEGQVLNIARP